MKCSTSNDWKNNVVTSLWWCTTWDSSISFLQEVFICSSCSTCSIWDSSFHCSHDLFLICSSCSLSLVSDLSLYRSHVQFLIYSSRWAFLFEIHLSTTCLPNFSSFQVVVVFFLQTKVVVRHWNAFFFYSTTFHE
jgi:hypothetical protein